MSTKKGPTGRGPFIDPRGAEVLPAWRRRWSGDRRHPRGGAPGGLLQLLGMGSRYRYTEERLYAGEPLYAIGEFRSAGGGRQAMNLDALRAEVIRQWKGDFAGLLARFDSNATACPTTSSACIAVSGPRFFGKPRA